MKTNLIEYIEQLEKAYEHYTETHYKNIKEGFNDYYYLGMANSVRATINDLKDIIENKTYKERLDKIL